MIAIVDLMNYIDSRHKDYLMENLDIYYKEDEPDPDDTGEYYIAENGEFSDE